MRRTLVALCAAVLLAALPASVAAAEPNSAAPISGMLNIQTDFGPPAPYCPGTSAQPVPDPTGCWFGTVSGDISGTIAFWEDPPVKWQTAPGASGSHTWAGHFFEKFTLRPTGGGWLAGYDNGLFNLKTGRFVSSGFVTAASPQWAAYVGYRYFEIGMTTDPMVYPASAHDARFFMAKAQGEAAD